MNENALQSATKIWVEAVREYYQNESDRNRLTQIFMRGYFAGWSERQVAELVDELYNNQNQYPCH